MILNHAAHEKVIRALCERQGLSLVFESRDAPRTDGKNLYVPHPKLEWDEDSYTLWLYKVHHELGHNMPEVRDCFDVLKDKKPPAFVGYINNLLEDHRQEWNRFDELRGRAHVLSRGRALFYQSQMEEEVEALDAKTAAAHALYVWDGVKRTDFMPDLLGPVADMVELMPEQAKHYFDKLMLPEADGFVPRDKTGEEVWELTLEVLAYLGFDPEEEQQEQGKQEAAGEEGEEGEASDGEDAEEGEEESSESKDKFSKYLPHSHDEEGEDSYSKMLEEENEEHMLTCNEVRVLRPPKNPEDAATHRHFKTKLSEIADNGGGIGKTVRRLLQVMSQSRYQHGLKSGKIGKGLHRATMVDAGDYQRRVFKKKQEQLVLDTAVCVLMDMSGSMSRQSKYEHAAQASIMLNDAIGKIGVPLQIVGFTEDYEGVKHYLMKDWAENLSADRLRDDFALVAENMEQNSDGESILWAYNNIMRRKNKRKVIIVLSDGMPEAYNEGCRAFTSSVIAGIEKEGAVELYAIGIMDSSVKKFYKKYAVITEARQLESALVSVTKNILIGE